MNTHVVPSVADLSLVDDGDTSPAPLVTVTIDPDLGTLVDARCGRGRTIALLRRLADRLEAGDYTPPAVVDRAG